MTLLYVVPRRPGSGPAPRAATPAPARTAGVGTSGWGTSGWGTSGWGTSGRGARRWGARRDPVRTGLTVLLTLALAACSGAGTAPTGTTPPGPNGSNAAAASGGGAAATSSRPVSPSDAPLDWSGDSAPDTLRDQYTDACRGTPVPGSAPYAGRSHPVAIIGPAANDDFSGSAGLAWGYALTGAPAAFRPSSTGQVQLVACATSKQTPAGTCGQVQRMDGVTGELRLTAAVTTVRVVVAATAREVARRSFTKAPYPCDSLGAKVYGDPPWTTEGPVNDFADAEPFIGGFTSGSPHPVGRG